MAKISSAQMRAQLETIAKKLTDGYTDLEIMKDLRISSGAFYNYKRKIFKAYGDIAAKKSDQSLELEAALLKDRYIRLYRTLELKMNEDHQDLADVAMAAEIAAFIATNILRLEVEGLKQRQGRSLQFNEQKALRYLRPLSTQLSEPDSTCDSQPVPVEDDENPGDPTNGDTGREGEGEPSSQGIEGTVF